MWERLKLITFDMEPSLEIYNCSDIPYVRLKKGASVPKQLIINQKLVSTIIRFNCML